MSASNGALRYCNEGEKDEQEVATIAIALVILVTGISFVSAAQNPNAGPSSTWVAINDLYAKIATLTEQINNIQLIPGPQGEQGPPGPAGADGAQGSQGPAGPAGTCNAVIVKGMAFNGDEISPPPGFTISNCDVIVRPSDGTLSLMYESGGKYYLAHAFRFYASEESDHWRIFTQINWHSDDYTEWLSSYPEAAYTVICIS